MYAIRSYYVSVTGPVVSLSRTGIVGAFCEDNPEPDVRVPRSLNKCPAAKIRVRSCVASGSLLNYGTWPDNSESNIQAPFIMSLLAVMPGTTFLSMMKTGSYNFV